MGKYDANKMRALLARKDRRGQTYEELSAEAGIPVSTLGYWRRRLREERGAVFDEVVIEEEARAEGARGEGVEVIGPLGHRVVVSSDFDPALLRRVLEALAC